MARRRTRWMLAGWLTVLWLPSVMGTCAGAEKQDDAPKSRIAGRDLSAWTRELSSPSRTKRLRAILTLPSFGVSAVKPLAEALRHADPAVLYWAASGLGDLAHKSSRTRAVRDRLEQLSGHRSVGVQLAASYALCRLGQSGKGVPILSRGLEHPHRGVACAAADFLARIGPDAREARPALQKAARHKDYHVRGAAAEALRRIDRATTGGKP